MEKELEKLPSLLTVEETARALSIKKNTVYDFIYKGTIKVLRFGPSIIRVPRVELIKWNRKNGGRNYCG